MTEPGQRFVDAALGEFQADAWPRGAGAWRNWSGSIPHRGLQVRLGLGGDAQGPRPWLLATLRELVAALDQIEARAAKALAECAPEYRLEQFHLESVSVWDEVDEIFEVRFESPDPELRANVETCWPAEQVVHHRIVIARDYRMVRRGGTMHLPEAKMPKDCPD